MTEVTHTHTECHWSAAYTDHLKTCQCWSLISVPGLLLVVIFLFWGPHFHNFQILLVWSSPSFWMINGYAPLSTHPLPLFWVNHPIILPGQAFILSGVQPELCSKALGSPWSSLSLGRQDPRDHFLDTPWSSISAAPVQLSAHSKTHPVYPAVQLFICPLPGSLYHLYLSICPLSKPGYDDIFPTKLLQLLQLN